MDRPLLQKSRLCAGVAVICALFLLETWNAHRVNPHPASPVVWLVLGAVGAVAAVAAVWYRLRARRGA